MNITSGNSAYQNAGADVGANDVDWKKALGADDGSLVENTMEAIKGVVGKIADRLDPLTEQYATLFKTGLRTPVMRKPSDYGMALKRLGSLQWMACRWKLGSFPHPLTDYSSSITQ